MGGRGRYAYNYEVQFNSESELKSFNNLQKIADYLNSYICMECYTRDMVNNFFLNRNQKVNPLLRNLFIIRRILK